jgi:hypothetical protein
MRMLILVVAVALATPAYAERWAEVRMREAVAAYAAGDYAKARHGFAQLANHGSAIAETMLGVMYADGKGVPPSATVAAAYFYRAANRGYGPAQLALSDAYLAGQGVRADAAKAYFWARLAATGGDRSAQVEARARLRQLDAALDPRTIAAVAARVRDWRPRAQIMR